MTPGDKFREWLSGFFPSNHGRHRPKSSHYRQDNFVTNTIQNIAADSTIHIYGDNNTVTRQDGQGDRKTETRVMYLLSQHIIRGAAHDDSARDPPPRCHPETRVKLIAQITTWFEGKAQEELLLWIAGPAGVGKSAIVQTFAEHLAESKSLGASVFISRPHKRNQPPGVFITIAYQLATRIEEYRRFIVEQLRLDPSLLSKGLAAQFTAFIVDPFVKMKCGAQGRRWGILLDGLDELEGEDAQCEIIQLIRNFAHEHRDAPLVWIIASRPESHISNTFDDDEVCTSHCTEYIPIDSTDACNDVEHFLRSSFKTIQKKFRHSVPNNWPTDTDFLKLTAAASGLFIYAQIVMHFIGDPNHGDPISRFQVLLSVISRSNAVPTGENPFVQLDALYAEIISSIPSTLWPRAKQILSLTIHVDGLLHTFASSRGILEHSKNLRGISVLFGIPRHIIYACFNKCRSTLDVPDWKVTHKRNLSFLHASFADYLKDSSRSGEFNVGNALDVQEVVMWSVLEIWNECGGDDIAATSVESRWLKYCSRLDDKPPSREISKLHAKMFRGMVDAVGWMACRMFHTPVWTLQYSQLHKVHMINLCYYLDEFNFTLFVEFLVISATTLRDEKLLRAVPLRDLKLDHLDWKDMSPAYVHERVSGSRKGPILYRPRSGAQLDGFMSELESFQRQSPQFEVVIFGAVPKGRVAAFRRPLEKESAGAAKKYMYYVIPQPE